MEFDAVPMTKGHIFTHDKLEIHEHISKDNKNPHETLMPSLCLRDTLKIQLHYFNLQVKLNWKSRGKLIHNLAPGISLSLSVATLASPLSITSF